MSEGYLIDKTTLTDNQKTNGMFNFIKTETTTSNKQPELLSTNCQTTYCDGVDLRNNRVYKATQQQPIQVVRKETNRSLTTQCTTTKMYKDHYSQNDNYTLGMNCPATNGSLPTGRLNNINLTDGVIKSQSGITTRTSKPIIRSGMQPNTAGQQNSGLSKYEPPSGGITKKRSTYSYSFRELLNNRRKATVEKSLSYVTKENNQSGIFQYGYGGHCSTNNNTTNPGCNNVVVDRLNNNKFYKQGSVDSSTRLERLKLETIKGQSNLTTECLTNNSKCKGRSAPFIRAQMGPFVTDISCTNQRKYKGLFNFNHTEVNYPQTSALVRVRGAVSHKTSVNPNGGVCCNNKPPQKLIK